MTIEKLFTYAAQEQMCVKCGFRYAASIFDDEGRCSNCNRIRAQTKSRINMNLEILLAAWGILIEPYVGLENLGLIYFMRGRITRRTKVGYTTRDPYLRLSDCQTGSPDVLELLGVADAPYSVEQELHKILEPYHSHGEWFDESKVLNKFIRTISYKYKQ